MLAEPNPNGDTMSPVFPKDFFRTRRDCSRVSAEPRQREADPLEGAPTPGGFELLQEVIRDTAKKS